MSCLLSSSKTVAKFLRFLNVCLSVYKLTLMYVCECCLSKVAFINQSKMAVATSCVAFLSLFVIILGTKPNNNDNEFYTLVARSLCLIKILDYISLQSGRYLVYYDKFVCSAL